LPPDLLPEERQLLTEVADKQKQSEQYLKPFRDTCDRLYGHYRACNADTDALRKTPPNGRDTLLRDMEDTWGADLVIPFAFSTVETILPRAISNRPRMFVLPRDENAERNVANMKALLEEQQRRIQYEMKLEETAKSGFIYGLGAQKIDWRRKTGPKRQLTQTLVKQPDGSTVPQWVPGPQGEGVIFDDWYAEDIDIADLFWDPFGFDRDSLRYVIHRTWRDSRYVLDLLQRGIWNTQAAQQLTTEDIRSSVGAGKYDEAHQKREQIAGFASGTSRRPLHEVWEFHDGERVITVLDRQIPVQYGINPAWHGQLPFAFFRPSTAGRKQLPGIGAIEPIADLLREMNTLRRQRRDNAALKLAQVFAYSDGAIDVGDLQFFPGAAIPVHGEPRDFLYPINIGDIPASSYNEEDRISGDMERTTGISDPTTGADSSGASQTATGAQLVQAAANVRIQRQTRRIEVELVMTEAELAVSLNQQHIVEKDLYLPDPESDRPGEPGPAWKRIPITPIELMGEFAFDIEGGTLGPKNIPQMRADAQALQAFMGNPNVDQRALLFRIMELYGFNHPDAILAPQQPVVPTQVIGDVLQKLNVDPQLVSTAIQLAVQGDPLSGTEGQPGPPPGNKTNPGDALAQTGSPNGGGP
jgi:hypothetical protein